jgi:alpha,alpha-trehalase
MRKKLIRKPLILLQFFLIALGAIPAQSQYVPDQQLGELFNAVQMQSVFEDSKTFADCVPLESPEKILEKYRLHKDNEDFDLKGFVLQHFRLPINPASDYQSDKTRPIAEHINSLWPVLTRQPDQEAGSLIPLPHQYVVPGGRFREVYYWDSYFTMLGLQTSGKHELIENMVDNFSHLIDKIGFIPNGNRMYYTGRSQPPFYSLMVGILREIKGDQVLSRYLPYLEKEYFFWMDGKETLTEKSSSNRRVVRLPDGELLNRYWDDKPAPRPESYKEDVMLAQKTGRNPDSLFRHIRAAAESGWDFSSRWFKDGQTLATIHTVEIIPVDLNSLLYHLELTIAEAYRLNNNSAKQEQYLKLATDRKKAIRKYCWDTKAAFFTDYDFVNRQTTQTYSLAALFPLYFQIASTREAKHVRRKVKKDFLKQGGLVTTLTDTDQQWDSPNGWAPLQWIGYKGLQNYKYTRTASKVASNWIKANEKVYRNTGKMVEKYNVIDQSDQAGGGEYPLQDGFGWSNGVLLRLLSETRSGK